MHLCVMGVQGTSLETDLKFQMDLKLWGVAPKFLSFLPFQTGSHKPPPPVGSVPLFNPAQVSQVRASSWAVAGGTGVGSWLLG